MRGGATFRFTACGGFEMTVIHQLRHSLQAGMTNREDKKMNPNKFTILTLLFLLLSCTCAKAADIPVPKPAVDTDKTSTFVTAYYFHGSFRCKTCRTIEQYSREAIEINFAKQLKSGKLVFQTINIDEPKNQHFVQDYQLVTRSLVLVKFVDGKQTAWKNLPAVWQKVGDQQAFFEYVASETAAYL